MQDREERGVGGAEHRKPSLLPEDRANPEASRHGPPAKEKLEKAIGLLPVALGGQVHPRRNLCVFDDSGCSQSTCSLVHLLVYFSCFGF